MPRDLKYSVTVRDDGMPWRTVWSGPGKAIAVEAALALAREERVIPGLSYPVYVHPWVRVLQGQDVVMAITPTNRRPTAVGTV